MNNSNCDSSVLDKSLNSYPVLFLPVVKLTATINIQSCLSKYINERVQLLSFCQTNFLSHSTVMSATSSSRQGGNKSVEVLDSFAASEFSCF